MTDALRVDDEKRLLRLYYQGYQIESPNGGFLMLLGVRPTDDGASAIFECSATSMRYEVHVPKGTRTERKKVREVLDAGDDPDCPRCTVGGRLVRAGRDLVCKRCGIAYAKV